MIKLDKQYRRLRKDVVAEYRRIVTPFFFFRIKPIIYKRNEYKTRILGGRYMIPPILLPKSKAYIKVDWVDNKGNYAFGDLKKRLEVENKKTASNVLKITA